MPKALSPLQRIEYPSSDGKPMAESDLHRQLMTDLINRLVARYADRNDMYVSGNLLVYYREGDPRVSLAPDCFVAFGVPNRRRLVFKTWEEGVVPSVVFEITSKTTRREDRTKKLDVYRDIWKVKEYFLFDPLRDYLKPALQGYRRVAREFRPLKLDPDGTLSSRLLGVRLVADDDQLRLFDTATGEEVLTESERRAETEAAARQSAEAELAKVRAELAALKKKG